MPEEELIPLCKARDLVDGGLAVSFDVVYGGQTCRAFAIRWQGQVHAYLNRCAHVAMEMDWQPDRFFDDSGQWLLCGTHGAVYRPDTGACGLRRRPLPRPAGAHRAHRKGRRRALAYCLQPPPRGFLR
jgi:nitrite reductase/ring-hydroxylating ferredoxin subunit